MHRDIKPANLFVTRRGHDQGARLRRRQARQTSRHGGSDLRCDDRGAPDQLTTLGTTIGTVSYMSPEQARGQEIDARSDLFSLGVVLYEMATGQLPFPGATPAMIFEGILTKDAAPPVGAERDIPPEFDRIVAQGAREGSRNALPERRRPARRSETPEARDRNGAERRPRSGRSPKPRPRRREPSGSPANAARRR